MFYTFVLMDVFDFFQALPNIKYPSPSVDNHALVQAPLNVNHSVLHHPSDMEH